MLPIYIFFFLDFLLLYWPCSICVIVIIGINNFIISQIHIVNFYWSNFKQSSFNTFAQEWNSPRARALATRCLHISDKVTNIFNSVPRRILQKNTNFKIQLLFLVLFIYFQMTKKKKKWKCTYILIFFLLIFANKIDI